MIGPRGRGASSARPLARAARASATGPRPRWRWPTLGAAAATDGGPDRAPGRSAPAPRCTEGEIVHDAAPRSSATIARRRASDALASACLDVRAGRAVYRLGPTSQVLATATSFDWTTLEGRGGGEACTSLTGSSTRRSPPPPAWSPRAASATPSSRAKETLDEQARADGRASSPRSSSRSRC